jgi:hypothetical protein
VRQRKVRLSVVVNQKRNTNPSALSLSPEHSFTKYGTSRLLMHTRKKFRKVVLIHLTDTRHGDSIVRTSSPLPPSLSEETVPEPWLVETREMEAVDGEEEAWVR